MQYVIKNRESVSSAATFFTPPINVSGMSLLTIALIAHDLGGTSPQLEATLQTSDNMEDWDDTSVTPTVSGGTDYIRTKASASSDNYGQYVRFKIVVTGTTPYVNYSPFLNAFASS